MAWLPTTTANNVWPVDVGYAGEDAFGTGPTRVTARERGGPLPPIGVADALLDERQVLTDWLWRVSSLTNSSHHQRI